MSPLEGSNPSLSATQDGASPRRPSLAGMQLRYWVGMMVAAFGWGTGGLAVRAALEEGVGAWTVVALRIGIAAVAVAALLAAQRKLAKPSAMSVRVGLVMALFNLAIPYVLFTFAYDNASAGFVGLLSALIPLATAIFANAMLPAEPLTAAKITGLAVGFVGVGALLLSGDSGLASGGRPLLSIVLSVLSVASIGYAGVYAKKHSGEYDPTAITGIQFLVAGLIMFVTMLAIEGVPSGISGAGWAMLLYAALVSTVLPFTIFYRLVAHLQATTLSLIGYMVPVVALVGGVLVLSEQIQPGMVVGGILIAFGVVLTDRADRKAAAAAIPH